MSFVLPPYNRNKGVFIVKHLEHPFFSRLKSDLVYALKQQYLVGLYYGFRIRKPASRYVDFLIAADNVVQTEAAGLPRLPLSGFNFIRDDFGRMPSPGGASLKEYDFLFVGTYQNRKGLREFVDAYGQVLDHRGDLTALCITAAFQKDMRSRSRRYVADKLQEMRLRGHRGFHFIEVNKSIGDGLPSRFIELAMMRSKALVVPSFHEGACRVVAEAEMTGLPIILRRDCTGGSANHLDPEPNILFDGQSGLVAAMKTLLFDWERHYSKKRPKRDPYTEGKSKKIFIRFLEDNFDFIPEDAGHQFSGRSFYNALSSHLNLLDSEISNTKTDEIFSIVKLGALVSDLTGLPTRPTPLERLWDAQIQAVSQFRRRANWLWS